MKQEVISELSTPELIERLEDESKQLVKLRLNHSVSPIENPMKLKAYRRTIARIKTELRKRQLQEVKNDNK
ncbi:MAG: 50S ribosomal protein L29 [Bacteroidales bacterium]|nr:50S ribosomal protein L29 [Bacteroidales bacterium]